MSLSMKDPPRLSEHRDQLDPVERIAGQAARQLSPREGLPSQAIARIAAGIEARSMGERRPTRVAWVLVGGAFLLGMATAASAAHLDGVPGWLSRLVRPRLASQAHPSPTVDKPRHRMPSVATVPPASVPPTVSGPEPSSVSEPPAPSGEVAPAAPPAASKLGPSAPQGKPFSRVDRGARKGAPAEDSPVRALAMLDGPEVPSLAPLPVAGGPVPSADPRAAPAALPSPVVPQPPLPRVLPPAQAKSDLVAPHFRDIVRALRIDHAPANALVLLDRYAAELNSGAFAEEALLLRVEAMMALGRRGDVLRLLDRISLTDVTTSQALLLARGELRAAANRCAEGVGDFDLVVAQTRHPPRQALLGRASCREKLGDLVGAQADLERYRREYPDAPPVP